MMKRSESTADERGSASELISRKIAELDDWRGVTLARVRALIKEADPEIVEELKWRGTPVWSHGGIVCTGETYKQAVKMTFAKGAALPDPSGLFNSSLDGNTRRAIDIHEGEKIDGPALKALIREAVALNVASKKGAVPKRAAAAPKRAAKGGAPKEAVSKRTAAKRAAPNKAAAKRGAR